MEYIIALDQGTSSSRAILFDSEGNLISKMQREFSLDYSKDGWVEIDPEILWKVSLGVLTDLLDREKVPLEKIKAIGITNQRETTILWDKQTGKGVHPAIIWQCRRTAALCEKMQSEGWLDYVKEKTGLVIDAYFSATKIKWILDKVDPKRERSKKGELLFGTVDTWLLWKLTKGEVHKTDYTNASRTMLFDIKARQWDKALLEYFDIPDALMPEVHPSSHLYGYFEYKGHKIPIAGIAGDQQAALFGQLGVKKGDVKNTYGTGCFMLMHTGDELVRSKSGLLTTLAASVTGEVAYALEGSVFIGGAVVQWLRDELGMIAEAKEAGELAQTLESNDGVYLVPAFVGLGAPYWDMYARGAMYGLTRNTDKRHFARASLEAVAYQSYDILQAMEKDINLPLLQMMVDGGASSSKFLMQFQADIAKMTLIRPKITETTALGAAYLAGLAVGVWASIEVLAKKHQIETVFYPSKAESWRKENYRGWQEALKKTLEK